MDQDDAVTAPRIAEGKFHMRQPSHSVPVNAAAMGSRSSVSASILALVARPSR